MTKEDFLKASEEVQTKYYNSIVSESIYARLCEVYDEDFTGDPTLYHNKDLTIGYADEGKTKILFDKTYITKHAKTDTEIYYYQIQFVLEHLLLQQ